MPSNEGVIAVLAEVLQLLNDREAKHRADAHPFMDKFGDHPETLALAHERAAECREIRWIVHSAAVKIERALKGQK